MLPTARLCCFCSDEEASTNESSQDDASDGATEELRLTEDGRIAYEGRMDMNFQTYPCALLDLIKPGFQATLARIVKDCREVCNVRARGASYSSGKHGSPGMHWPSDTGRCRVWRPSRARRRDVLGAG